MTAPLPLLDLFTRAHQEARRVVDAADPSDLVRPTPCPEWDLRGLINHMTVGNFFAGALISDAPPPDRSADLLGPDHRRAYADSVDVVVAAFRAPAALDRIVQVPAGTMPGAGFAGIRTTEALVHGWDVARSLGRPADLDEELCEQALAMTRRFMRDAMRGPGRPFAEEQQAPPGAPAADRLAAWLGRSV
ncbi:MAG: TIGR03086 family metal-binding protein [Actinomycetota bacterium]|nr:TIGR03086 family metal-binding protein [Actinomycetota bacterium]